MKYKWKNLQLEKKVSRYNFYVLRTPVYIEYSTYFITFFIILYRNIMFCRKWYENLLMCLFFYASSKLMNMIT